MIRPGLNLNTREDGGEFSNFKDHLHRTCPPQDRDRVSGIVFAFSNVMPVHSAGLQPGHGHCVCAQTPGPDDLWLWRLGRCDVL